MLAMRQRQGVGGHNQMGRFWSLEMQKKQHSHKVMEVDSRLTQKHRKDWYTVANSRTKSGRQLQIPIEMDMAGIKKGD